MKKITVFILSFALIGALFTGCRGRNEDTSSTGSSTVPATTERATTPTVSQTQPSAEASTEAATDVTTTPTDGMMDPTGDQNNRGTNGNPSTGDSGMTRLIPGMN